MPDFLLAWKYRRNFAEKMQTNVDITKLKEMVVSATDAYYNTVVLQRVYPLRCFISSSIEQQTPSNSLYISSGSCFSGI